MVKADDELKTRVLVLLDYYLPGFKAGGALRSISNLVDLLGDEIAFSIVTSDRDSLDTTPYTNVSLDEWQTVGKARVYYVSSRRFTIRLLNQLIVEVDPHVVYLNSLFSRLAIIFLATRRLGLWSTRRVVVAPRGELAPGALSIKAWKKRAYLALARATRLCDGVTWQAATEIEAAQIAAFVWSRGAQNIVIARDLSGSCALDRPLPHGVKIKNEGSVRFVFLSRISPKKNLIYALECLRGIQGLVEMDIIGPIGDADYWNECRAAVDRIPGNIHVSYRGPIDNDRVQSELLNYHFMVLPTMGESYGHVIREALAAGCPVLISDQTPWSDVADEGAGWSLPLGNRGRWISTLQDCVYMSQASYLEMSAAAVRYLSSAVNFSDDLERSRILFRRVVAKDSIR